MPTGHVFGHVFGHVSGHVIGHVIGHVFDKVIACVIVVLVGGGAARAGEGDRFQCLAAAYPDWIKGRLIDPATGRFMVVLADGTRVPWDDGIAHKSAEQRLAAPDLEDMLADPYPAGAEAPAPAPGEDPGRVRVDPFFNGLYGGSESAVNAHLESVDWPVRGSPRRLSFNGRNGAAASLREVGRELARLPAALHTYFTVTAGTFNWRPIAGTNRPSAHSWGIAVDINVGFSDYWRWNGKPGVPAPYRNRIPLAIVGAFERHGFVWGGRWHHFDTMHFEYRPELLDPRCVRRATTTGPIGPIGPIKEASK